MNSKYSVITNPRTGRKVNVFGKLGKSIIKNYLSHLIGSGSSKDEDLDTYNNEKKNMNNELRDMFERGNIKKSQNDKFYRIKNIGIDFRTDRDLINWENTYRMAKALNKKYGKFMHKIFKNYIVNMLECIIENRNKNTIRIIEKLDQIFTIKTQGFYLTGCSDWSQLLNFVKNECRKNIGVRVDKRGLEKVVGIICPNIRTSLTFIDFMIKALEKVPEFNTIIIKNYIEVFDDCIRARNFNDKSKNIPDNELCNKVPEEYWSDVLPIKPGFNTKLFPTQKDCYNIPEPIEKIMPIERSKGAKDYFRGKLVKDSEGNLKPEYNDKPPLFKSGLNIFRYSKWKESDKKVNSSYGTFAAGISGHTIEISLMMRLFMCKDKDGKLMDTSSLVSAAALIWMSQYYHHSLREIVMASLIHSSKKIREKFMRNLDKIYKKDTSLKFYEIVSTIDNELKLPSPLANIYDLICSKLDSLIKENNGPVFNSELLNKMLNNEKYSDEESRHLRRLFKNYQNAIELLLNTELDYDLELPKQEGKKCSKAKEDIRKLDLFN